jgi:3-isopropylmalate/(R)-2-methylmalate dehydratase small subunit
MTTISGPVYVLGDNIDTDQIIPAEYLNLVPTIPDEYKKLGSYALVGLPLGPGDPPFVTPGAMDTSYRIIVAGKNFGCGSSREHAPIALGAAGAEAVVAESFARIFFRNCINIGMPIMEQPQAAKEIQPGDQLEVDLDKGTIKNLTQNKTYQAAPFPEFMQNIVNAGGLMTYVKKRLAAK